MTFERVIYDGNEGIVSKAGEIKQTITLNSGNFVHEIYRQDSSGLYDLLVAPSAQYINLGGELVDNENMGETKFNAYYTQSPYRGVSQYLGSDLNEYITLLETKFTDPYFTTSFYNGGKGKDVLFYPANRANYSLLVNPLGIYQLKSGGAGYNEDFYYLAGFEQFETTKEGITLNPLPLGIHDFTYGRSSANDYYYGPNSQNQLINDNSNIYFLGQSGTSGTNVRFPGETIDFFSGTDILIYPRPIRSSSLLYKDGEWILLSEGWSEKFTNLEFIVFTDVAYELKDDGKAVEHQWTDVADPIDFLAIDTMPTNPVPEPTPTPEPTPAPVPTPTPDPTPDTENPVYRLYNSSQGKHLFSSNQFEIDLLTGNDWQNEGVIYYAPEEGTADVFRFYIPSEARHFYTASQFERDFIIGNQDTFSGWQYEGAAFSAYSTSDYPSDAVAVVRYLNLETASHVYSTSSYEQGILDQNATFMNEGIAWFGDPMFATESLL